MSQTSRPDLSVVLPAYEEGENLAWFLPRLRAVLGDLGVSHEVLVIDTVAPTDATPDICRKNGVKYFPREGGNLYSHAVKTGIAQSTGSRVVMMDCDGSHDPQVIPKLWAERDNADLVIASRYVHGGHTENPAILIALSLLVNLVFRWVLRLRCRDVSNSFRLYRGDPLRALRLECANFDIVEEILIKLSFARPGFLVREVPFTFGRRRAGRTKRDLVAFALSYLATLARFYRMEKKFGKDRS
jgi:dolichol-phosphate mannosyltransferase